MIYQNDVFVNKRRPLVKLIDFFWKLKYKKPKFFPLPKESKFCQYTSISGKIQQFHSALSSMTTGHESQLLNGILRKEQGINYGLRKLPESLAVVPITRTKVGEHSFKFIVPALSNILDSWGVVPDQSNLAGISAESLKSLGHKLFDNCHRKRRPGAFFRFAALVEQRVESIQSSLLSMEENARESMKKL